MHPTRTKKKQNNALFAISNPLSGVINILGIAQPRSGAVCTISSTALVPRDLDTERIPHRPDHRATSNADTGRMSGTIPRRPSISSTWCRRYGNDHSSTGVISCFPSLSSFFLLVAAPVTQTQQLLCILVAIVCFPTKRRLEQVVHVLPVLR